MSVSVPASHSPAPIIEPRPPLDAALAPPADNHAVRSGKLGLAALGVYGSGALIENITTTVLGALLLYYLTIVCGLSGAAAGIALGLTLVVDSVIDPVVGSLSDNSRSRHGRRHPFMLASVIPLLVTFGLLFSVPRGLGGWALFGYALVVLFSLRVAISLFYVPYMALGAELTDDYAERSTVVAGRVLFTVVGGITATVLMWGVFLPGKARDHAAAYPPLAWTFAGILAACALLSTLGTLRARNRLHAAPAGRSFGLGQLLGEVVEVLRNRSFLSLFFPCLILFTGLGAAGALTLHANAFFWKLNSGQMELLGVLLPVGVFGGIFLTSGLAGVIEKRTAAMLGLVMLGLGQAGPVTLRLSGLISASGGIWALCAAVIVAGFGVSLATIAFQSMMADATDEHEHLFGARREGLYFAGITLSAKASSGLGAFVGGVTLDLIGFPHGGAGHAAALAHIPATTIRNLGIAYGPGAAIFTAVAIAVLLTYKLSKADVARIQTDLVSRRAAKAAG